MAKGRKTGGRNRGTRNKLTAAREDLAREGIRQALAENRSPLSVVLTVMRGGEDSREISERMYNAAVVALPYVHPRLSASVIQGSVQGIRTTLSHEARLRLLELGPEAVEDIGDYGPIPARIAVEGDGD